MLLLLFCFFFFKHKTAYEMRISDWSSDVCSSDLAAPHRCGAHAGAAGCGGGSVSSEEPGLGIRDWGFGNAGGERHGRLPCRIPNPESPIPALHGNTFLSASADCSNGPSSTADCCSCMRIGPKDQQSSVSGKSGYV